MKGKRKSILVRCFALRLLPVFYYIVNFWCDDPHVTSISGHGDPDDQLIYIIYFAVLYNLFVTNYN